MNVFGWALHWVNYGHKTFNTLPIHISIIYFCLIQWKSAKAENEDDDNGERHRRPFSITLINPQPYITEQLTHKYPQNVSVMYLIMSVHKQNNIEKNAIYIYMHKAHCAHSVEKKGHTQKKREKKELHDPHQPHCNSHKHCWFETDSTAF